MACKDGSLNFDTKIDSSGFKKGVDEIGGVAKTGLALTGKALGATATTVTALGGAAIKVGSDFESGMSQVQAIMGTVSNNELPDIINKADEMGLSFEKGANATETAMNIVTAKAKEMGASTKFSATESAEALNYMAMAGWKTEDMLDGIEGIMNLAAASGEDLAATSDIVTDALTAFGMKAGDATHFADILAAASSNANTNVSMMGETFKYVAPLAGSLGYSAEDTAMAIGLMANAGIKGSQAGTSLRSILSRMAKPTNDSADAMYKLGVALEDDEGNMYSFMDVLKQIRDGFKGGRITQDKYTQSVQNWKKMLANGSVDEKEYASAIEALDIALNGVTESQKAEIAAELAGQEAMSGLLAVVNASDKDFDKLSGAINNCNGSAAEMAEIMQDNLQGQITILQSGLEGLGISMYETMQDTAKDVVKEAQGMVQELQTAFNDGGFQGLVGALGNVLAQIVQRIAEAAPMVIGAAVSLVISFCDGLKNAPGIGESGASLITSLVTGLISCTGELWTTAIVLIGSLAEGITAGGPQITQSILDCITDILGSLSEWGPRFLTAGIEIIKSLGQGIADTLPTLAPQIVDCTLDLITAIVDNADTIADVGIDIIIALADGLINAVPILIQKVPDIIIKICDALDRNLIKIVKSGAALVLKLIEGIISAIPELAKNLPKIFEAAVRVLQSFNFMSLGIRIITEIANGLVSAGEMLFNAARNVVESVHTHFTGLPGKISEAISSVIANIAQWGQQIYNEAVTAVGNTITGIVNFFAGLPEKVAYCLGYVIGTLIRWNQEVNAWVVAAIPAIINNIVQFFSELPNKIWTWLVNTVTRMVAWGQQMLSTAKTAISNMISSIISLMTALPGKVATQLSNVISKVIAWGSEMASKGAAAAKGLFDAVVGGVSGLPSKMAEIGSNIVSGIWNGISSGWNWLKDKVANLANSLLEGAKDALDINSPSGKFRDEFGRWIMPGAVEGVKKSMPKALREMKEQAGELLAAMQKTVNVRMNEVALNASGFGNAMALGNGGTIINNDNRMNQENHYHERVISPAETAKNQREAFRKFAGGVK